LAGAKGSAVSTQFGYFLIADITGYTGYLSSSELDHAQQTLTALLNLLIKQTKPPLVISRLAGDAVISYGLREGFLQGQTFVETLEQTYVAFRRAVELMVRNTTCPCNACRNIGALDLKFFVHYGEFAVQKLDAHDELVGSDVNLLHRLLKNHVTECTGLRAYTLYTDAAIHQLGLDDSLPALIRQDEEYEHLGTVTAWIQDMHPVWESRRGEPQIVITPDKELAHFTTEIALPPEVVWDYLVQPEHMVVLAGAERMALKDRKRGRVDTGTVYECFHGGMVVREVVVEWHPFSMMTVQIPMDLPIPVKGVSIFMELKLDPTEEGTRFTQTFSKASGPVAGRVMAEMGLMQMLKRGDADMARFKAHVEADAAEHRPTVDAGAPAEGEVRAAALASLSP
jgi:uncharacterized protein YndB with AHSA1/START domain